MILFEGGDSFLVETEAFIEPLYIVGVAALALKIHKIIGGLNCLVALAEHLIGTGDGSKDSSVVRVSLPERLQPLESGVHFLFIEQDFAEEELGIAVVGTMFEHGFNLLLRTVEFSGLAVNAPELNAVFAVFAYAFGEPCEHLIGLVGAAGSEQRFAELLHLVVVVGQVCYCIIEMA